MAKRGVGLHIGEEFVSVVELAGGLGRPTLVRFALEPIHPQKAPGKDELVVQAIQRAMDKAGIKQKEVIYDLPPEDVTVRYFKMARLTRKERTQGVKFEAKRYIPFKLKEITSDFQIVETKGAKEMEVIFAAVKRDVFTHHISILQKAALKAKVIDAAPFSLMTVFHLTGEIEKGKTTAIVDINIEGATISILKDKVLYLTRNITLTKAPEEPGKPHPDKSGRGKPVFENLLSELSLSFDYYKKQFPEEMVAKVILCGEGSFEGWDELLARELNLPVTVGDFRKGIKKADKIPLDLAPKLAVACGLALRELVKPIVKVNLFLRKEIVPVAAPMPKELIRKVASIEIVVCGLLILAIYFGMFTRMAKVRSELDGVIAARPIVTTKLTVEKMSPMDLEGARGRLKRRLGVLETIIKDRIYWTVKLNELAKVLPEGTWLDRISLEERVEVRGRRITGSLILEGGVFSMDKSEEMRLVNRLVVNLREDGLFFKGFQEVELSSVKKARKGAFEVTNFTLTCFGRR